MKVLLDTWRERDSAVSFEFEFFRHMTPVQIIGLILLGIGVVPAMIGLVIEVKHTLEQISQGAWHV